MYRATTVAGWILAALVAFSLFFPSALNWGVHFPAFFPFPAGLFVPLLMAATLFPSVRNTILARLENPVQAFARRGKRDSLLWSGALLAAAGVFFWLFRQQAFLLGDGLLATRNLSQLFAGGTMPAEFRHSPVPAALVFRMSEFLTSAFGSKYTHTAYQVVSVLCGLLALGVLARIARIAFRDSLDRLLGLLFMLAGGTAQFFFGYVEMYTPVYLVFISFLWLGFEFLRGSVRLWVPLVVFGLLVASHFGMLWFLPAAGFLLLKAVQRKQWKQVVFGPLILLGVCAGALVVTGYPLSAFLHAVAAEGGGSLLPLAAAGDFWRSYPLLSVWHALDVGNLLLLVAPCALLVLLVAAVRRPGLFVDPLLLFATLTSLIGILFVSLVNLKIGMSRDWDVAALNLGALGPAALLALERGMENRDLRRTVLIAAVGAMVPLSASWILVNASWDRALSRQQVLIDERLWSPGARAYALDDIGGLYRDAGAYDRALGAYSVSLGLDSTAARRWAAVGAMLEKLNRNGEARVFYERAAALGTDQTWIYTNLGIDYIAAGRFDDALSVLKAGLDRDHGLPLAAYNIGTILSTQMEDYEQALEYFRLAIHTDPQHADAYRNAGSCLYYLGRYDEMREYYIEFLALAPDDPSAPEVRELIERMK